MNFVLKIGTVVKDASSKDRTISGYLGKYDMSSYVVLTKERLEPYPPTELYYRNTDIENYTFTFNRFLELSFTSISIQHRFGR